VWGERKLALARDADHVDEVRGPSQIPDQEVDGPHPWAIREIREIRVSSFHQQ